MGKRYWALVCILTSVILSEQWGYFQATVSDRWLCMLAEGQAKGSAAAAFAHEGAAREELEYR